MIIHYRRILMSIKKIFIKSIMTFIILFVCLFTNQSNFNNIKKVDLNIIYHHNKSKSEIQKLKDEYLNNDIKGLIKIENENFKTVVVQTNDNEYYLNHNLKKEIDKVGSTFMDYRNSISDKKLLIYGHNSRNINTDFHILENYLDYNYLNEHRNITLELEDITYNYRVFSIMIVKEDYHYMKLNFNKNEYKNHIMYLKENSIYDTNENISDDEDLLILQTCNYNPVGSYLLIISKKII